MTEPIQEIPQAEAPGEIKNLYDDIRCTLRVSTVPWLFRALATHPKYFQSMWEALRPAFTNQFEVSADAIRAHAVSQTMQAFKGSNHRAKLKGMGYSLEKLKEIQDQLSVYHYIDPKLLLIVTALRGTLEGVLVPVRSVVVTPMGRGIPVGMQKIAMIEPHQAVGKVAEILADVQRLLELPVASDEFRTLAQWPEHLELAWGELKRIIPTADYAQAVGEVQQLSQRGRQELRRRVDLTREDLLALGISDAEQSEIKRVIDFFYRISPKLVVAVAFWMLALAGPEEAMMSSDDLMRWWSVPRK